MDALRYTYMVNKIAFTILVPLFFICCSDISREEIRDDEGNLVEEAERSKETGDRQGLTRKYGPGEVLMEEAEYRNDTLHGERRLYYPEGSINIVEQYDRGRITGQYFVYHPGGELEVEGQYIEGAMEGEWQYYYPSGQLKEVVTFENNEENGPFMEYYEDGTVKAKGQYKGGDHEHGIVELYDKQGELERKLDCVMGRCTTIWHSEMQTDTLEN